MRPRKLLYILVIALVAWKLGTPILRLLFGILSSGLAAIFGSSGALIADPSSLKAAIRNVTTDYDQVLSLLLNDFDFKPKRGIR